MIYEVARQEPDRAAPRRPRAPARHVRRSRPPRHRRAPDPARRHRRRAAARARVHAPSPNLLRRGLTNHWGYNTLGFFAPHAGVRAAQRPAGCPRRVQGHGQAAAPRPASRSSSTSSTTTRPSRAATGMTLSLARPGQARLLPARRPRPRHRRHRLRQHPRPAPPRGLPDGARLAALLGAGVPRRRLPVRPRASPWAAGADDDYDPDHPFLVALRTDPVLSRVKLIAEPWDLGIHGWRTGQFPPPFSGVERPVPRRGPVVLARPDVGPRPDEQRGHGVQDLATRLAGSQDLFGTRDRGPIASVNFVAAHDGFTARRPHGVRRQAQRGQRRGQPRRQQRQPVVEPRRRGPDRRPGRPGGPAAVDAQPARHPAAVHRRADDQRRRRVRAHPGRQQQRVLPGQRDVLVRLGPRAVAAGPARDDAPPRPAAGDPAGAAPAGLPVRPAGPRRRLHRHRVVRRRAVSP